MPAQHAERSKSSGLEAVDPFETGWKWKGGGMAGLAAALVTGVVITVMDLQTLQLAIAGLYGQAGNVTAGWMAHMVHGTVFGIVFTFVLMDPTFYRVTDATWKSVLVGVGYGTLLAIVGAGIVMPIWLGIAGFPTPPSIPNLTPPIMVWHLIYGLLLGGAFCVIDNL